MSEETNFSLSSLERAQVIRLLKSVNWLLSQRQTQLALATMHKGEIIIQVREGVAIEISPKPDLRVGKELQADEQP